MCGLIGLEQLVGASGVECHTWHMEPGRLPYHTYKPCLGSNHPTLNPNPPELPHKGSCPPPTYPKLIISPLPQKPPG
ncbi:Hypp1385 [Branchiostoma lanceolatum]|uniref:Hypp1385 protein n=1 Tax=Branchiostoma lanceolatum TaxID=7740 RepID=A0A8J9ZHA3_BRALA|nr:Hypp1385 [Branchiostoma lanceolatum]